MLHLFRPVKIWRHYELRHYHVTLCVRFFQNDDNQVNIGDPIEHIEYHIPYIIQVVYMPMEKILPRRISTTACILFKSFWPRNGSECRFAHKLPINCKNLSGVTPPNPRPVLGHRAVLFPDSCCFGSHNFQIVPARLVRGYRGSPTAVQAVGLPPQEPALCGSCPLVTPYYCRLGDSSSPNTSFFSPTSFHRH